MYHPDYHVSLPTFLEGHNVNDIIELGDGIFIMDYNLLLHNCNVTIKGNGSERTKLIIPEDIDYIDDAIIDLQAQEGQEIDVTISGLTIEATVSKSQAQQANNRLTREETYLIKCYNVKSFIMRDVKFLANNLPTTCIDIRRGFNIDIRECEFKNFNRRWTGGCIWLRGDIENVSIEDNDFYKYGNDEVIALYSTNNYSGTNNADEISKKNVNIRFNMFYSQDDNGGENTSAIITENGNRGTWDGCNQRFIAFYTNQDSNKESINGILVQRNTPCHQTINGIHLCNNEFHINAPLSHLITVAFDKYTTFKNVSIRNNIISYGTWTVNGSSSAKKELVDFCIFYDTNYATNLEGDFDGFSEEPFYITDNTITCGTNIRNIRANSGIQYYVDNHTIVNFKGTKVFFNKNTVICTREGYTADEQTYANKGVEVFHCGSKGGELFFSNNHCEGLRCLLSWSSSSSIVKGRAKGFCNYLQGDTRILHLNVHECHDSMINNEIIADYPIFFLEEFADTGTAMFIGNRVHRDLSRAIYFTNPNGLIYYTGTQGANNNIQSMSLLCCDNIFDNVNAMNIYSYQQSGTMRTIHKNNVFADANE